MTVPNLLTGKARVALGLLIEACMLFTNLFLLWFGTNLVKVTWNQSIAEFPGLSVGVSYLPVPVGGLITALFVIERLMKGNLFPEPHDPDAAGAISAE
jgi:TRAP-type C4-dicarboxylate transport system permease small subunit